MVAVVLLSGGLDSATALAIAKSEGQTITALSFRYGQRHLHELEAAQRIARRAGVEEHVICEIDLRTFGGSALTDDRFDVPHGRMQGTTGGDDERLADAIPITYVPARNTIFLSFALGLAEVREADEIFIGVNAIDYSGYPDCRPEYIEAFGKMAALATRAGISGRAIRIRAPLMEMTKADIIRRGLGLGVDYGLTHSCYDPAPDGAACGTCDACQLRLAGFAEVGRVDPARYLS